MNCIDIIGYTGEIGENSKVRIGHNNTTGIVRLSGYLTEFSGLFIRGNWIKLKMLRIFFFFV